MIPKRSWIVLGLLAATLLWSPYEAHAQKTPSEDRVAARSHRSVDGTRAAVLHAGTYRILSLVGQPVAGRQVRGSGGSWQVHQQRKALEAVASLNKATEVPAVFALEANYPNPFNPATTISFALPEASPVRILVFDLLGRQVAQLMDAVLDAGRHQVVFDAEGLASGLYIYRMEARSFEQHRMMLLMK